MRAHITIALHRLTLHGISTNGMMIITITDKQGRSYGGISVYIPPKSVYLTNFMWLLVVLITCGTLTCFDFEIGMTS